MAIGEIVRLKRLALRMSQEELGRKLGVSHARIGQIERGTHALSLQMAKELTKIFNCTLDDLAG